MNNLKEMKYIKHLFPLDQIKITVLVNDTGGSSWLLEEHGLSLFIETPEHRIFFDTGQGNTLVHNATFLDIDLASAEIIVLSHGHYDHTSGLTQILSSRKKNTKIYAHPDIFIPKYRLLNNGDKKYIGMPYSHKELVSRGANFHFNRLSKYISPGIRLTGEIPRKYDFEQSDHQLFTLKNKQLIPDLFHDDQALILETNQGLLIIFGCGHSGICNTLSYAIELTGQRNIVAIIGGLHLLSASINKIKATVEILQQHQIGTIYPCHCTGTNAINNLSQLKKTKIHPLMIGDIISDL